MHTRRRGRTCSGVGCGTSACNELACNKAGKRSRGSTLLVYYVAYYVAGTMRGGCTASRAGVCEECEAGTYMYKDRTGSWEITMLALCQRPVRPERGVLTVCSVSLARPASTPVWHTQPAASQVHWLCHIFRLRRLSIARRASAQCGLLIAVYYSGLIYCLLFY